MSVFEDKVFGNGSHYVYYQRLAEDQHFGSAPLIYMKAMSTAGKYNDIINSLNLNITGLLRGQANAEKQKEINVLKRIAPNVDYDSMSPIELINQINELIGLGKQYKNYLNYLKNMYPTANNNKARNLSPVVSSYISGEIATIINSNYIDDFVDTVGQMVAANGNTSQIKHAAEEFANKVINDFIADKNNMTTQLIEKLSLVNHTLGDEYLVWKDLFDKINQDASIKSTFIADVMKRFGLSEKVQAAFRSLDTKKIKTPKTAIRKAIKVTAAPQGGYVYEVITGIMQGFGTGSNISTSRLSDKGTTDLATVKVGFEFENLVEEKLSELESGTKDKADAVKKITEFTEFLEQNVGDGFIIYGNAKSYRLDSLSDMEGYFKGGTRNIRQLPSFMAQYDIPIADDVVDLIINTIPGAILEGNTTVQNFLTKALAGQVARLLFDDWTTIGNESGSFDAIHVFNLSGITIPLSYLLEKLAEAAEQATDDLLSHPSSYIQVQFNLPPEIKFREPSQTTRFIQDQNRIALQRGEKRGRGNGGLQAAWNAQREEALRSTFGINFLSNFNNLLNQLMESLGI